MTPPLTIKINSDGNELEYVCMAGNLYCYKYIKSKTKKLSILKLTEPELIKLIKINEP